MGNKIIFAIVVAHIFISASAWAVPETINYQGKLTDLDGGLLTGTYGMRFYLCDGPAEGTCNWSEEQHVEVTDGIFNVLLGNTVPIPMAIFEIAPLFLEVQINTSSEWEVLSPRQPLTSVGYSFTAEKALNVANDAITSLMIQNGAVSPEDVEFNYAESNSKGGPATDLLCDGCVSLTELNFSPLLTETDPKVGTLDNEQWCVTNGSVINCTQPSPITFTWGLAGNEGTIPAENFLGTVDNQPLEIRVAGMRALRIERHNEDPSLSPNIIEGDVSNAVMPNIIGSIISGGGAEEAGNVVTDNFGTIGGGKGNMAGNEDGELTNASHATVGGGRNNSAQGMYATIGGGSFNQVIGKYGTISGGGEYVEGDAEYRNRVTDDYGTIGGGAMNQAGGDEGPAARSEFATVGGGWNNKASYLYSSVGGGVGNEASDFAATVGGGYENHAIGGSSSVGGGYTNIASGYSSTVCAGEGNEATGVFDTIGGGYHNTAEGDNSTVGGGNGNTASGVFATVPGGRGANASHFGQMAYASGSFGDRGSAQTSVFVLRNITTSPSSTELFLDGSLQSQRITIEPNSAMTFDILVVGRNVNGNTAGFRLYGVIENEAGTVQPVGTIKTEDFGMEATL